MPVITYREAIKSAMAEEMERDERVVIMGEDIGLYGGTHLVTDGLLDKFGPKRVMDTPIAEGGFTGAAIGMAMAGMRPIVEMMTWNFSFQAADQIVAARGTGRRDGFTEYREQRYRRWSGVRCGRPHRGMDLFPYYRATVSAGMYRHPGRRPPNH